MVSEGGSVADLRDCADGLGVAAVYVLADGEWVSYILAAPGSVTLTTLTATIGLFADGVPAVTPLVVRSDER